jgi:hypothetical protein
LGLLAFFTVMVRGLMHGGDAEQTLGTASLALFVFAAIGFAVGELAGWIVQDSVRASLVAEMARQSATKNENPAKKP